MQTTLNAGVRRKQGLGTVAMGGAVFVGGARAAGVDVGAGILPTQLLQGDNDVLQVMEGEVDVFGFL